MSSKNQDFVPEKVQESLFNEILHRAPNLQCADCNNKGPTWASIDFGVLICIRCSGVHRQLGPHITRVRSAKLDKWKKEQIEIMSYVGNKLANDYYEYKLPHNFRRITMNTTPEDCFRFVKDKYIKKNFAPPNYPTPVEEFLQNKEKGLKVELTVPKENPTRHASTQHHHHSQIGGGKPIVRKKSLSLDPHPQPPKENEPNTKLNEDLFSAFDNVNNNPPKKENDNQSFQFFDSFPSSQTNNSNQNISTNQATNKSSSAFDFDFSAIQTKNSNQNENQNQNSSQNPNPFSQSPQQQNPNDKKESNPLDLKKLYQQQNVYNQYPQHMMMNNGFNNFPQNQQFGFNGFPQNNQAWNNGSYPMNNMNMMGGFSNTNGGGFNPNVNMSMNMGGPFPNNGFVQQQPFMNQMPMNNFSQQNMQNQQSMQKNFY